MMMRNKMNSFLYGGNAPYVEEQYEQYLEDTASVTEEWRHYFDALRATPAVDGTDTADTPHAPVVDRFAAIAKRPPVAGASAEDLLAFASKQVAVQALIHAYRMVGARKAHLDPLEWAPVMPLPDLSPGFYGLSQPDLGRRFSMADTSFWDDDATLGELLAALEKTYCGTLASEFMHLSSAEERRWWQLRLESTRATPAFSKEKKLRILERLSAAEGLEKYLHTRYVGQKRFSLEGGESLIVLLDELICAGASKGVRHAVMGMAHRGRLNVLLNIAGKPPRALFDEFEGHADPSLLAGDVKYHKGYAGETLTPSGPVEVTLAFNPSHLEIVNPVVQGICRGKAEELRIPATHVLPVEIHGDAAIAGQGIVQETLSLSYTRGHGTGGTIHVVVNNQVGFTTSDPRDARSSYYCTDIAKSIEAPILHVNGDDPEAVALAAQLAVEYRAAFNRSVVVELVCFRRHGHQEQDTPDMTQPLMYRSIAAHPGARSIYAEALAKESVVTPEDADRLVREYREWLDGAKADSGHTVAATGGKTRSPGGFGPAAEAHGVAASLSLERVTQLARGLAEVPQGFKLHPLVARVVESRRDMASGNKPLDWGMGEHLAFASLLAEGVDVRLSGQDSERGTFGHRHAVLHNQIRERRGEGTYSPLEHVGADQGRFRVTNSILSEAAVLAFEYGYSVTRPAALVLWEAQFGDFANGAQVVIDQFISAGEAKWGQPCGITMLLPHGQEGQGPEHASARLERYLQLCAQNNLQVCQPTTPAQFFHLLRRQARLSKQRPLIVMTPKSLLRSAAATSSLDELARGDFQRVIGDALSAPDDAKVERVILCSGKVFYELAERRRRHARADVAIVRIEQIYPFPADLVRRELSKYSRARAVVWCQEEPENQGAWRAVEPSLRDAVANAATIGYAGPAATASTAPGYAAAHALQQEAVLVAAFAPS